MIKFTCLLYNNLLYNHVRGYYNIKPFHSQTKWWRWVWNSNEVTTTVCIHQIRSFQVHIKIIQVHKKINQLIWFLTFWNCPWYMYFQGTVNTESERGVTPSPLVTSGCNGVHVHCTVMYVPNHLMKWYFVLGIIYTYTTCIAIIPW